MKTVCGFFQCFGCCRPIPSNDNLQKERHIKLVMQRLGENGMCYITIWYSFWCWLDLSPATSTTCQRKRQSHSKVTEKNVSCSGVEVGWGRTFCIIIKQVQHPQGFRGKGEKKKSYKRREKSWRKVSRVSISITASTAAHYLSPSAFLIVLLVRKHR
jgi:hypothetical protein